MEALIPFANRYAPLAPPRTLTSPPTRCRRSARLFLEPRDILFAQGDATGRIFTIAEGAVMILRQLPDGRRQIVDIAGPGRTIGFSADRRHDCVALALTPCEIRARARRPGADDALMLAEIHRLRDLAITLGRKQAIERLATFLLEMMGEDFDLDHRLDFPVSRQEIADYLGLVLETVCRNFVALKRRGVIAPANRESVFIRDIAALRRLAACEAEIDC